MRPVLAPRSRNAIAVELPSNLTVAGTILRHAENSADNFRLRESAGGNGPGGRGQVVIGDFARDAAQRRERMHVTADEGFETLAVGGTPSTACGCALPPGRKRRACVYRWRSPVGRRVPNRLRSVRRAVAPSAERHGWVSTVDERCIHTRAARCARRCSATAATAVLLWPPYRWGLFPTNRRWRL